MTLLLRERGSMAVEIDKENEEGGGENILTPSFLPGKNLSHLPAAALISSWLYGKTWVLH